MRQKRDEPPTQRLLNALSDMVANEGDNTLVNGHSIYADWSEASPNRIQMFIVDMNLAGNFWLVDFVDRTVLDAPYNLRNGSQIEWVTMGWKFSVRHISPDTAGNVILGITALVESIAGI